MNESQIPIVAKSILKAIEKYGDVCLYTFKDRYKVVKQNSLNPFEKEEHGMMFACCVEFNYLEKELPTKENIEKPCIRCIFRD